MQKVLTNPKIVFTMVKEKMEKNGKLEKKGEKLIRKKISPLKLSYKHENNALNCIPFYVANANG